MESEKKPKDKPTRQGETSIQRKKSESPQWASGLKQLYDSVVEEPLPDSFKDLLSELDKKSK